MDADSVVACELDRAQHQHLRPGCGQLQHLLVREGVQLARLGDETRVGGEDALDVGVDLAHVGLERGRERDRRRVRPAAAERRHLLRSRDALEAGDEHDRPLRERVVDALRPDLEHLRARVLGVGDDARLRARERDRGVAEVVDRHRGERARDPLADREQHVELARVRDRRDLMGQIDEVVGRPAHRREDADDVVARVARRHEPARNRLQPLRTRDGCATELLDDETHDETLRQSSARGNGTFAGSSSTKMPDIVLSPHMQQCMPRTRSRPRGFGSGSGHRTRVGGLNDLVQHWSQSGCASAIEP